MPVDESRAVAHIERWMNQSLPVTITKNWVGYVAITLTGLLLLGLAFWAFFSSVTHPWVDPLLYYSLAVFVTVLIVAGTSISLRVYSLSYITLTQDGVQAMNYLSLFASQDMQAEWVRVQDVSVVKGGLGGIIGYGTLHIQTAGTVQKIDMTMVSDPEKWQSVIEYYADVATKDGMDQPLSTGA